MCSDLASPSSPPHALPEVASYINTSGLISSTFVLLFSQNKRFGVWNNSKGSRLVCAGTRGQKEL